MNPAAATHRIEIGFADRSPDELMELSRGRGLSLNLPEMAAIQKYFNALGRDPTDAELETLAQTWSEHCNHKSFRASVTHTEKDELGMDRCRKYKNLLKETIMRVTEELRRPWCVSVFKDNAGIVSYDGDRAIAFKVETHNHPSALEPYGGAGTGLGGVIRDIMGAGLGARPIASTDVFCFAPLQGQKRGDRGRRLSTRRIFHGVVSGVRDYGNRMGIPTVNGAVYFDEDFADNPLVFCGTVGILPVSAVHKEVRPGDRIVMVGGRVGRDGIHGATFSSDSLSDGIPSSVVQIGNPIVQKKMMDALLQARDRRLYRGVTDCGAGGLSSAVGEMGAETGASVSLERVPLKYTGLTPWEIWLSESQERMVLAVPPENMDELRLLLSDEDVECSDIGEFTDDGRLRVNYRDERIVDLKMSFLHDGVPKRQLKSFWSPPPQKAFPNPTLRALRDSTHLQSILMKVLAAPTVASKEWIIRQYDHEVQGRTVLKPLVGVQQRGPGDAAVLRGDPPSMAGVAVSNGLCPHFSRWDPYWMAASAIDESIRNLIAVGARLDRVALLDNFCGGDPQTPKCMGELVRAAQACYDVALAYGTPFISGKDSLNNQFVDRASGGKRSIPTTLLVSAIAGVDDIRRLITMDFKRAGNWIYVLGTTRDELGGSQYGRLLNTPGGEVPRLDPKETIVLYERLSEAIHRGWVVSCHDCSDGGLGVALAEMAIGGAMGLHVDLDRVPVSPDLKAQERDDKILFSESNGRFVAEVPSTQARRFEGHLQGVSFARVGQVRENGRIDMVGLTRGKYSWSLRQVETAWREGLTP
ncbi:MAG TPA: phosphoribosylformylglycinamidine synthase subunit PurL [Elusimicrobiota bacterium]|nr:phosphoribosylformylglycinamidine synthase subunit PurL [Elusimicrobiota bacterium]